MAAEFSERVNAIKNLCTLFSCSSRNSLTTASFIRRLNASGPESRSGSFFFFRNTDARDKLLDDQLWKRDFVPVNLCFCQGWNSLLNERSNLLLAFIFLADCKILLLNGIRFAINITYDNSNKHTQHDIFRVRNQTQGRLLLPTMNHEIKNVAETHAT